MLCDFEEQRTLCKFQFKLFSSFYKLRPAVGLQRYDLRVVQTDRRQTISSGIQRVTCMKKNIIDHRFGFTFGIFNTDSSLNTQKPHRSCIVSAAEENEIDRDRSRNKSQDPA